MLLLLTQILSYSSGNGHISVGGSATLMQAFMETLVVLVGAGVFARQFYWSWMCIRKKLTIIEGEAMTLLEALREAITR
ncbi:hypothetical protein A2U01_0035064, partial [Trifolium medium]|nr:hypothetical protein [Trifolium medium]